LVITVEDDQIMSAFEQFQRGNPKMAKRPDGGYAQKAFPVPGAIGRHDVNETAYKM
jgi:hypothetical protein